MACYLLRFLQANRLRLCDRSFLCHELVRQVRQRHAHLLAGINQNRMLEATGRSQVGGNTRF
jgi:hypothetical protein